MATKWGDDFDVTDSRDPGVYPGEAEAWRDELLKLAPPVAPCDYFEESGNG